MSLDVYLVTPNLQIDKDKKKRRLTIKFLRELGYEAQALLLEDGEQLDFTTLYSSNITHNLRDMAEAAGLYLPCWRPEDLNISKASQLIPFLATGLAELKAAPEHYELYNSSNGWGLYKHFVPWVEQYLQACQEYPDAYVNVSR